VAAKPTFEDMKNTISKWLARPLAVPFIFLVLAIACYGLLINRLGYYWDDFPLTYIYNKFENAGLLRYYSTNRPIWGFLFQITFNLFNQPWQWQLYALFCRWLSALLVWLVLREVWPNHQKTAAWAGMLFLVYPGFKQQNISIIYGNLFLVMDCFLLSLFLNIKSARQIGGSKLTPMKLFYQVPAVILSFYNLMALEYFFTLELIRPIFIWNSLESIKVENNQKIRKLLSNWFPFLLVWIVATIWRIFFFTFQTHNYQMVFFTALQQNPFQALLTLVKDVASSFWVVIVNAWANIFLPPNVKEIGIRTTLAAIAIIIVIFFTVLLFFTLQRKNNTENGSYKGIITAGIVACLLGGVPWWITGLPPTLRFPSDRFTLPFLLGVSLLIVGIVGILPFKLWIKLVIVSLFIGFAAGKQFQVVNEYRRDWETQRRFFWQLAWRMPGIEPGTILLVNDLPVTYYSDNSLTAPLNWFWAPMNNSQELSYLLLYPSQRVGSSLKSLKPGIEVSVDYLAAKFQGNTSKVVAIFYEPPACLRVLDRTLDSDNRMLPMEMQAAAALSDDEWVLTNGLPANEILPDHLYNPEPNHGWCYYFETADLARQKGDWSEVASIGDIAYQLNDYPNDPSEHFPFIEGYAHTANWERANELTMISQSVTPLMKPLLCRLWQRIDASTDGSDQKKSTVNSIYSTLECAP
jgi:hypothetical protein